MTSVLTRLKAQANADQQQKQREAEERWATMLSMRAFLEDLERSVPTINGKPLRVTQLYNSTKPIDWDTPDSTDDFQLYSERTLFQAELEPDRRSWKYRAHHRSFSYYNPEHRNVTTAALQAAIIDLLAKEDPRQFRS